MATKPIFTDAQTRIPAIWANSLSDLLYDVFGLAKTPAQARTALGLKSLALQAADEVAISGGAINGTPIGAATPAAARFTSASVTVLIPASPNHLTSKSYVDGKFAQNFAALNLQDMSRQSSSAVAITGGSVVVDTLRVRNDPANPRDAVPLAFLQAELTKSSASQAASPMAVANDNRTVALGFTPIANRVVLFVDGIYQLPDQYSLAGSNAIFTADLPAGSIVGGFQL